MYHSRTGINFMVQLMRSDLLAQIERVTLKYLAAVKQAAIYLASFQGADRNARLLWPINAVASRRNLPFVSD